MKSKKIFTHKLTILLLALLLLNSCWNGIIYGVKLKPIVTSNVPAQVSVNGKIVGTTPCNLKLKRHPKKADRGYYGKHAYCISVSATDYYPQQRVFTGKGEDGFTACGMVVISMGLYIPLLICDLISGTYKLYKGLERDVDKKAVVHFDLQRTKESLDRDKRIAEEKKRKEEELKRIKAENERKAFLEQAEQNYKKEVNQAKERASTKPGWSVIEFKDGYYIGETKDGKREGYGEYYWKNLDPLTSHSVWEAKISYKGRWSNDTYNGQGSYKYYYQTDNVGLWTAYYHHYCEIQANFVNGKAEGEGYFAEQTTGFLAGGSTYDYVLYKNGGISRNYSKEARQAKRDLIKNSDCYQFIEKRTVSYYDGGDRTATGYKIKCVPPSNYSFEHTIYYNPGGDRYSKGWYKDDGGLLFQDGGIGANKNDTFEQAAKKSCGCY